MLTLQELQIHFFKLPSDDRASVYVVDYLLVTNNVIMFVASKFHITSIIIQDSLLSALQYLLFVHRLGNHKRKTWLIVNKVF